MENPTSFLIIPELKLILTYFQGSININDIIQMNLQLIADKSYDSTYNMIMDFRDSTALAFKMDITDFFEFFKKTITLKKKIQCGIMYSTPNQKILIAFYIPTAMLLNINAQGFRELNKCLDWMHFTPEEQLKIKEALSSMK
jgi:hypothetical protein